MQSQILVVDVVRNWHKMDDNAWFPTKDLEHFAVSLISTPVEYEGTEEFSAVVLWDDVSADVPKSQWCDNEAVSPTPGRVELHTAIHETVKRFAKAVGCDVSQVNHTGLTTKIKLKAIEPKNIEGFDFLEDPKDVTPEEPV